MKFLSRLFDPLRRTATAFFKHDVALRRTGGAVHIVLEQRAARKDKAPTREELLQRKHNEELVLIRRQLGELLASMPQARSTMRHLVFVEQSLAKKGLKALHKLPLDVLQHSLAQLEGLVTNWSPEGLANLRSKMAVAIIDREHMDTEADAERTAAALDLGPAGPPALPEVDSISADDGDALAAAYAALGSLAPAAGADHGGLALTGEPNSASAKAGLREAARPGESAGEIKLRERQSS